MRPGRASRTAQHNALFRALESALPPRRRAIDDPLARDFLDGGLGAVARAAALPGVADLVSRFIDHRWPGVRSSVVARTRFIDDAIEDALAEPVEQLVILGAGLDSRAYRLPALRELAVFEVDHPDTQAFKRRALARALPAPPKHVRYVAIDFARDDLATVLAAAGHRADAPAFLLWEGVTNYLTEAAVAATLAWCGGAAPGSRLLFTYVHRDVLTRPEIFVGTERLRASLDKVGERFTYGIDPAALPALLAERNLELLRDLGAAEYRELCYGEAARAMRGHEFYRIALARVR